jgi:hypothetical protein
MKKRIKSKHHQKLDFLRQLKANAVTALNLGPIFKKTKNLDEIRWIFLIPGIVLGIVGAVSLSDIPNWFIGLPAHIISLWAIWNAFPPISETYETAAEKVTPLPKKDPYWSQAALALIAIWGLTYVCFQFKWWFIGGAGVLLIICGFYFAVRRYKNFPHSKELSSGNTVLIILLILAVLLRYPFIHQNITGFQNDEATNLLGAMDLLKGNIKNPFGGSYFFGFFPYFVLAPAFKIFGISLAVGRGTAAFVSLICIIFFFRWCRLYFGLVSSGLATTFFSYCWWSLFDSLSPFFHIIMVLVEIIAFYYLALSLRNGRRLYFGLTGIFLGLCFQAYIPGRSTILIVGLAFIASYLVEGEKFLKTYWKHSLLLVFCFLWAVGPYLASMLKDPKSFFGHVQDVNIWIAMVQQNNYALPLEKFLITFYTFFWPNTHTELGTGLDHYSRIDPFTGLFSLLGIIVAIVFFRRRWNQLALITLLFAILSNALSKGPGQEPNSFSGHRCTMALPILCFFMAQGMDWALGFFASKPKIFRWVGIILLTLMTGLSFAWNIHGYFFKFDDSQDSWDKLGFAHLAHVEAMESFYPKDHIVLEGHDKGFFYCNCWDQEEQFLTYQRIPHNEGMPLPLPIRAAVTKDVVIFFTDWEQYDGEKAKIRKLYPKATWKDFKNKFGYTYLTTVEISKEDVQSLQTRMKLDPPLN